MLDVTDGRSLRSVVLDSVDKFPESPALVVDGKSYTYSDLDGKARRLAATITHDGGARAERIAVFAYRSLAAYVGTLAALYSGAAFVPLNRKFPPDRTRAMIDRADVDAVVVDYSSASLLPDVVAGLERLPRLIAFDNEAAALLRDHGLSCEAWSDSTQAPGLTALPPVLADDLAYLLFTSGTTGEPKGVGITHANILHYLYSMSERFGVGPGDRCSQTFEQTFDVSVFDLFVAWSGGATVYAMKPIELLAPVRYVQKHALTVWFSVPSVVALAISKGMLRPDSMPTLRYSLFAGEPLPVASASAWQIAAPNSVVENLYGPTEATITCLGYRWLPDVSPEEAVNGIVPIGLPHPGLGTLVVDEQMAPVEPGHAGELLVCGPQVAPGYWRDEVKTADKFVSIQVSAHRHKRFYRTGDRVIRDEQGNHAYIGRVDNQIKVMGFRVELGEIEAVLLRDSGAVQAAAVGWPIEDGRALGIVAFYCGTHTPEEQLLTLLSSKLPPYMVPKRTIRLDEMPVNTNGKIDRQQLLGRLERHDL